MSAHGAFIRSVAGIGGAVAAARALNVRIAGEGMRLSGQADLPYAVQNVHLALTHLAFLQTIQALIERGGGSRGGYMILDEKGDLTVETKRGSELRHRGENMALRQEILEARLAAPGDFAITPVPVRPLPQDDSWYETTWRQWLSGEIFSFGQ
jgi:hypothetical protein